MEPFKNRAAWHDYVATERARLAPWLAANGYILESEQPHVSGERYLMSGRKLVLVGRDHAGARVVIKASSDMGGRREIRIERTRQQTLHRLPFAYYTFRSPRELHFADTAVLTVFVTEFIEQPVGFLQLPLKEQFNTALDAFQTFAGVHATTYAHARTIKQTFGVLNISDYGTLLAQYEADSAHRAVTNVRDAFAQSPETVERYCNFLVHEDFALHNMRIQDGIIYLIDHSSLQFGNKHETWARFLNFMLLYNQELEQAFMQYAADNFAPEEQDSLWLMRALKAAQLVAYHARSAEYSRDTLHELSVVRVDFWADVAAHMLERSAVPSDRTTKYTSVRDQLRSDEERARQRALQQLS